MDLNLLKLFADVAAVGSFAAVARTRAMDPSLVSRGIASLEREVGARLFLRTTRRVTLSEAGEAFLARIAPLTEELERAVAEAADARVQPKGTLRLTASVTFGQTRIVPLLPAFRRRYPDLSLECIFTDSNLDLVAERIDLAVRLAPAIGGDLIAVKLVDTHYRVVAAPDYLERAPSLAKLEDLSAHSCLLFNLRAYRSRWRFRDGHGDVVEVPIRGDITLSPAGSVRDAALSGLGPALLPDWLVDGDIAAGRLMRLFPEHEATATTFETAAFLIYPSRSFLPRKVRVMIDFLQQSFKDA
ncbi:LysR family transcriptional regulator [Nitratireductor soli]|uniref:LysR family transcriptional regulator n=1 Tax=Nitratireductor soli TaxID=1670619 RepID=UPI00065E5949|nr:LysR family transcriptional regulator [Nitratireductor soli]